MLERGEAIDKAVAAPMDKEPGRDRVGGVAEAADDFRPTVDAIGKGRAEVDAEVGIMFGDGDAVALAGEDIGAGDENAKRGGVAGGEGHAVSLEHGLDGFRVALRHPTARGVLIHDYHVDGNALITAANFVVATQHNIASINTTIKDAALGLAGKPDGELLDGVEFAIRCYDPCLSCSTHRVGQMPLEVNLWQDGRVLRTARR